MKINSFIGVLVLVSALSASAASSRSLEKQKQELAREKAFVTRLESYLAVARDELKQARAQYSKDISAAQHHAELAQHLAEVAVAFESGRVPGTPGDDIPIGTLIPGGMAAYHIGQAIEHQNAADTFVLNWANNTYSTPINALDQKIANYKKTVVAPLEKRVNQATKRNRSPQSTSSTGSDERNRGPLARGSQGSGSGSSNGGGTKGGGTKGGGGSGGRGPEVGPTQTMRPLG